MSRFARALIVSPLADGRTRVLAEPFSYDVGELGSGDTIEVARGFKTDFASIPRLFWIALPKWGKYGNSARFHPPGVQPLAQVDQEVVRNVRGSTISMAGAVRWLVRAGGFSRLCR